MQDYEIGLNISGKKKSVYEVTYKPTGKVYAMKILTYKNNDRSKNRAARMRKEFEIQHALCSMSDRVVKAYNLFHDPENQQICMIVELCDIDLKEYMSTCKVTESKIKQFFRQITHAVKDLHDNHVVHRDIKPENILLKNNFVKLADFGFATVYDNDKLLTRMCGTPNYVAPEILLMEEPDSEHPISAKKDGYSKEIDIWSLGVLLYALLYGTPPFETSSFETTYKKICHCDYTFPRPNPAGIDVSAGAQDMIVNILKFNPYDRPSLDDILNHYWLND